LRKVEIQGDRSGKNKVTPKQERFCQEYIIDLNATQAVLRAGYSEKQLINTLQDWC